MSDETHIVEFMPSGRGKAQYPADPNFPNGREVQVGAQGVPSCTVALPYPAPECGFYLVLCTVCRFSAVITVAGRADDPTKVTLPCKVTAAAGSA